MPTIEIDFDVYKALTMLRKNEADSYNAVLRRKLQLPLSNTQAGQNNIQDNTPNKSWVSKGIIYPDGSEFRALYKGTMYFARVTGGRLVVKVNGNHGAASSLSRAARLVTNTSVDGWKFWEVKRPSDIEWRKCSELRPAPSAYAPHSAEFYLFGEDKDKA